MATAFQLQRDNSGARLRPHDVVKSHIQLLQRYNDLRDVGQQLVGLIADNRGVSIGSLYKAGEFGLDPKD